MLKDNVIAITGGAGLIGSSFSRAIVKSGGKVIIGDVSNDKGRRLQDELGKDNSLFIDVTLLGIDKHILYLIFLLNSIQSITFFNVDSS